jgi:hypothetical protein
LEGIVIDAILHKRTQIVLENKGLSISAHLKRTHREQVIAARRARDLEQSQFNSRIAKTNPFA